MERIREKQDAGENSREAGRGSCYKMLKTWLNDGLPQFSKILYESRNVKTWFHQFDKITEIDGVIYRRTFSGNLQLVIPIELKDKFFIIGS